MGSRKSSANKSSKSAMHSTFGSKKKYHESNRFRTNQTLSPDPILLTELERTLDKKNNNLERI